MGLSAGYGAKAGADASLDLRKFLADKMRQALLAKQQEDQRQIENTRADEYLSLAKNKTEPDPWERVDTKGPDGTHLVRTMRASQMTGGVPAWDKPESSEPLVPIVKDGTDIYATRGQAVGQPVPRPAKPATPRRNVLGQERTAIGFYNRMDSAINDMDAAEPQLSEKDLVIINSSPLPELVNNRLLSTAGQQYVQALRTYTEARLRKESGAAINNSEYENDRKMIGRASGETPESLAQKKATRLRTLDGIGFQSGQAFEEFYGKPFSKRGESVAQPAPPDDIAAYFKGKPVGSRVSVKETGETWELTAKGPVKK